MKLASTLFRRAFTGALPCAVRVNLHPFTGVDYVAYYSDLIREEGAEVEIIFANQAKTILDYTDCVLTCDIHTRRPHQAYSPQRRRQSRLRTGRYPQRPR